MPYFCTSTLPVAHFSPKWEWRALQHIPESYRLVCRCQISPYFSTWWPAMSTGSICLDHKHRDKGQMSSIAQAQSLAALRIVVHLCRVLVPSPLMVAPIPTPFSFLVIQSGHWPLKPHPSFLERNVLPLCQKFMGRMSVSFCWGTGQHGAWQFPFNFSTCISLWLCLWARHSARRGCPRLLR